MCQLQSLLLQILLLFLFYLTWKMVMMLCACACLCLCVFGCVFILFLLNEFLFSSCFVFLLFLTSVLKSYVQPVVLKSIVSGTKDWLAEMRKISCLFVNLIEPLKESKLKKLQEVLFAMQSIIYKYEGLVRQFMIDDKGCVFIGKKFLNTQKKDRKYRPTKKGRKIMQ
jgi:hypothetical protein